MFSSCSKPSKSLNRSSKNTTWSARLPQSQSPFSTCANKFDFGRTMCTSPDRQSVCETRWSMLCYSASVSGDRTSWKWLSSVFWAPDRALTPSEPSPAGDHVGNQAWKAAQQIFILPVFYIKPQPVQNYLRNCVPHNEKKKKHLQCPSKQKNSPKRRFLIKELVFFCSKCKDILS